MRKIRKLIIEWKKEGDHAYLVYKTKNDDTVAELIVPVVSTV